MKSTSSILYFIYLFNYINMQFKTLFLEKGAISKCSKFIILVIQLKVKDLDGQGL